MNAAHVHLMLNHIPVFGSIFGLALLIYGLLVKSDDVKKAALGVFVVIALITLPVFLTGEPAEEIVEHMAGISEPAIESHETSAVYALVGAMLLGLVSLVGVFKFQPGIRDNAKYIGVVLALAALVTGIVARTATLGGQINHPEIRSWVHDAPEDANEDSSHR